MTVVSAWQYQKLAADRARRTPIEPDMEVLELGEFTMGSSETDDEASSDERPPHKVVLTRRFAIGKYEVTFAEVR